MVLDPDRNQRGSALVIAVIVILIVTVIGLGILRAGSREVAGSAAGARNKALVACAEAARQLLVSRFHALGLTPTSLEALNVPLDGTAGNSRTWLVGGHFDENPDSVVKSLVDPTRGLVQVSQVSLLPDNSFGPTSAVREESNVIALTGQGGKPIKVIVHCVDQGDATRQGGRQLEVEFGVRFGL
jgi:hypothetical protein